MKRDGLRSLIFALSKIYLSNMPNKEVLYRKQIFDSLQNMGGVYIKFLQALCLTQNFMSGWGGPKEYSIFNQVFFEPINLKEYVDFSKFKNINEKPVAAGSFAIIYEGYLLNSTKVVIKILRPSIRKNLKKDLLKLKKIVKIMSVFLPKTVVDYNGVFNEFANNCLKEIDYKREVANIKYFYKIYKNHPYVIIPNVYEDLCNDSVIIEDYIEGPTLNDILCNLKYGEKITDYNQKNSNIWTQLIIIGGESLRTAMTEDYVFGDPHPGNIILLPNNKIAFIDFGIIAPKPDSQEAFYLWTKSYYDILNGQDDIGSLFKSTLMCFCPNLINALNNCNGINVIESIIKALDEKRDKVSISSEAAALIDNGHLFKVFYKFIDKNNSLNIKIESHNFGLLKSMQAYLCTLTTIDNKYGNSYYAQLLLSAMEYALKYCEKVKVNKDYNYDSKYTIGQCYEILIDSLSSLAIGDEILFNTFSERL